MVNTTEILYLSSKFRLANFYPDSTQADFPDFDVGFFLCLFYSVLC